MKVNSVVLNKEELNLLAEIDAGEWEEKPLSNDELDSYREDAKYTKLLNEKNKLLYDFL